MANCIFCKIAQGEIPSTKVYEDQMEDRRSNICIFTSSADDRLHGRPDNKKHALTKGIIPCFTGMIPSFYLSFMTKKRYH